MTARIKNKFVDRYTGKIYRPGEIVELAEERLEEILRVLPDAVEAIGEPDGVKAVKPEAEEPEKVEKPKKAKAEKKAGKAAKKSE